jgi:3-deoxy-D-manno-octulosonic-acid transferase
LTIWIHALSVGEVTSALPLVKAIRDDMSDVVIIFTAATRSGKQLADTILAPHADLICYGPFDLWFAIQRYVAAIRPDLFILVETDFWPNWLWFLNRKKIPAMLVNGRISEKSFALYTRFSFIFKPMFQRFSLLSMQTEADAEKMIDFGINADQVITLGNLKYDMDTTDLSANGISRQALGIAEKQRIWVCGSTHAGEEIILFSVFARLAAEAELFLILAPRDIGRAHELTDLARKYNLQPATRTARPGKGGNVLILDTIGELSSCYRLAHLAFVGGSLVARGGHNPIEPAACEVPVLFGPHMEDFSEIAQSLIACGGAETVTAETLPRVVSKILNHNIIHAEMAEHAGNLVRQHRGGMTRHMQAIHQLLEN